MIKTLCVVLATFMLSACGGKKLSEDLVAIRTDVNRISWDVAALKKSESTTATRLDNLSDELAALKAKSLLLPESNTQQSTTESATKPESASETQTTPTVQVTTQENTSDALSEAPSTPQKPRIVIIEDIEMMGSTLYSYALELYNQREYEESIEKFSEFLTRFPSDSLAPNAQYWLGENYYSMKDYEKALEVFQSVQSDWPDSAKAPDALLKEGYSYNNMGERAEATKSLSRLVSDFPSSNAAALAKRTLARW
jgi:tol-pal system protein YbgF